MDTGSISTNYKQVTVDVPEDRVAEFHAFFARFLAGRSGRGARGRYGRPHHHRHGEHGRCAGRRGAAEDPGTAEQATPADTTEI
jgi:hypothetical protein